MNQRLTVNYGLRYEIQKGRTERYDRLNWFDFDAVNPIGQQAGLPNLKGGLRFLGDEAYQWNAPLTNFAPRLGIAYKINEKLVARAGYGIFYLGTVNVPPTVGDHGFFSHYAVGIDSRWRSHTQHLLAKPIPQRTIPAHRCGAGTAYGSGA